MNHKFQGHKSGDKGNIVHKALEILGLRQLAIQENKTEFYESELDKLYQIDNFKIRDSLSDAIDFYLTKRNDLTEDDLLDCITWFDKMITEYIDYTPLNRNVKAVEKFFDFEIPHDWAKYEFEVDGEIFEGRLGLKGTMDLLLEVDSDTIEYVDFKTGRRKDWVTDEVKTPEKLQEDFQFLLYFYALKHEYPEIKTFMFCPVYIKDGGPFPIYFDNDDVKKAEDKIRVIFEAIKHDKRPKNIKKDYKKKFKCNFCSFKTQIFQNGKSYCDFFEKEIMELGMERVTNKYMDKANIGNYGSGGGQSERKV